jgi:hypothetical protein
VSKNLRTPSANLNSFPANLRPGMLAIGGFLVAAITAAPQIVASSVVVVDTGLSIGLSAGFWLVELRANLAIANPAHNVRWTFAAPDGLTINTGGAGGASVGRSFLGINGAAGQEDPFFNVGTTINGGTTSAWTSLQAWFGVQVKDAGTLMFQFAQGVSGASNTQLLGGSTLRGTMMADKLGN